MADWSSPLREKKAFENPTRTWPRGFRDLLRWVLFEARTPWPEWIEIQPSPQIFQKLEGSQINCVMVNHATLLLQTSFGNILTDPVFSDRTSPFSFVGPHRKKVVGIQLQDLPKIDFVLVSHNHYDHMDMPSLRELWKKHDPEFLMPLENLHWLHRAGVRTKRGHELNWWDVYESDRGLRIHLTPAQHWSSRGPGDRNHSLWGGFWIEAGSQKIFFAGDTGYADHFKAIQERLGAPTLSLLPIGAYEPRWFMIEQHMNPEDAVQAHLDLESAKSVAIHWGTWQLTNEGHLDPVEHLREALQKYSIPPGEFIVLENGENIALREETER